MSGLIPLTLTPAATSSQLSGLISPGFSPRTVCFALDRPRSRPELSLSIRHARSASDSTRQPEWKKSITEIKSQHLARKYRACWSRCQEMLENLNGAADVEPLYLIYLHFYAANAMEMLARPLPATSCHRKRLLQQARDHYDRAAHLVQAAETSVAIKTRSASPTSSLCSSSRASTCPSPASTATSETWTAHSSPTSSICSIEGLCLKSQPSEASRLRKNRPKKKVSFSLPEEEASTLRTTTHEDEEEPSDRPDSPTLGFFDDPFRQNVRKPEPPQPPPVSPTEPEKPRRPSASPQQQSRLGQPEPLFGDCSFMPTRAPSRYYKHLADLRSQLVNYTAELDSLIDTKPTATHASSDSDYRVSTPRLPSRPCSVIDTAHTFNLNPETRLRIERLRSGGWQRKRFDARRYEQLRDSVMAELDEQPASSPVLPTNSF